MGSIYATTNAYMHHHFDQAIQVRYGPALHRDHQNLKE